MTQNICHIINYPEFLALTVLCENFGHVESITKGKNPEEFVNKLLLGHLPRSLV